MMRSCMTKLEFLPEQNMIFRLRKLPLIYAACIALSLVKLCWCLYESFVMLLKSRSCTHHPHMHYSYTGGRRKNMPSILIHSKMFYSYTGGEHKNMLVRFSIHQINALSSYYYLSNNCYAEKKHGLCKSYSEKREEKKKSCEKWTQKCLRYWK